ncbi:MAG: DUF4595 domain-containing protein [Bacteroides sp.]
MKVLLKSLAFLVFLTFSACLDDEFLLVEHTTPFSYKSITVTETTDGGLGAGLVNHSDTYSFGTNQRLLYHLFTQQFVAEESPTLQHETTLAYTDKTVTVTDAFGHSSVYTLDVHGYATACTRTEGSGFVRHYAFRYAANPSGGISFTGLTETINQTVTAELELKSVTPTQSLLTVHNGEFAYTYHLVAAETNVHHLPWLYLTELYPLNLHADALYAHLLGEAPSLLLQTITPEGNQQNEQTTYTYTHDERGYLTSCTETLRTDGVNYPRILTYVLK